MEPVAYYEDRRKALGQALLGTVAALLFLAVSAPLLLGSRRLGYIEVAFAGAIFGGSLAGLAVCVSRAAQLLKPAKLLLAADETGVTLHSAGGDQKHIPWQNISAFLPAGRGMRRGIAVALKDTDAYLAALSPRERKLANQNRNFFGTPAAVSTSTCSTNRMVIIEALNKYLYE